MNWVTGGIVYCLLWWLCFFIALPFGFKQTDNIPTGFADSAPEKTYLFPKALFSTFMAIVLWCGVYWIVEHEWITLDRLSLHHFVRLVR